MRRPIYFYEVIEGDPASLERTLLEQLPQLITEVACDGVLEQAVDGSFPVRLQTPVLGLPASKRIRVSTGVAARVQGAVRVPLSWTAEPARHLFPGFEGAVELVPLSRRWMQLTLLGEVTVPLSIAGAAADVAALHAVGERTLRQLLQGLAAALPRRAAESPADARPSLDVSDGSAREEPMVVADVMTEDPLVLKEDLPLHTAAVLLHDRGISGAPVVSDAGDLVGVLSEGDVIEKEARPGGRIGRAGLEEQRRHRARSVGDACSRPARTTTPQASLHDAARAMLDRGVGRLVVVDRSRIVGIVTRHDVLRALIRTDVELHAAVGGVLADLGEPEIRTHVEGGVAELRGFARQRSAIPGIVAAVEAVDGIIAVEEHLRWREDDVAPMPMSAV